MKIYGGSGLKINMLPSQDLREEIKTRSPCGYALDHHVPHDLAPLSFVL